MKFLLLLTLLFSTLFSKPYMPQNVDEVIFTIEESIEHQAIGILLKKIKSEPQNLALVHELSTLYIETAKVQANSMYMGYAKALLAPYLKKYPNVYEFKMYQADILQYTHKFDEALALLENITAKSPKEAKPYLLQASIYQAKKDYDASLSACKKLLLRSSHLLSATCIMTAKSHLGSLENSYDLLKDVYEKTKDKEQSEQSWALTSLADMAYRLEKKEEALVYLNEALNLDKKDYFVLSKMSEIYLEQEKYQEVKTLLEAYEYVDALLLRLTVAKEKLHEDTNLAKANLQAYVKTLNLRNELPHEEDMPYFKMLGIK